MARRSATIPAIISICLSWLLPVIALLKFLHQRATEPCTMSTVECVIFRK